MFWKYLLILKKRGLKGSNNSNVLVQICLLLVINMRGVWSLSISVNSNSTPIPTQKCICNGPCRYPSKGPAEMCVMVRPSMIISWATFSGTVASSNTVSSTMICCCWLFGVWNKCPYPGVKYSPHKRVPYAIHTRISYLSFWPHSAVDVRCAWRRQQLDF